MILVSLKTGNIMKESNMKADTYISFYLKANCIHIYVSALRDIGSPKRICFMIDEQGRSLLVAPYKNTDFKSHSVPVSVYSGRTTFRIFSVHLCGLIASSHNWDPSCSYRVPGKYNSKHNVVVFNLNDARTIGQEEQGTCAIADAQF